MKNFNDSVLYIRNGKKIPAIVLKSSTPIDEEQLNLLYADPENGPQMVNQGTASKIGLVAIAVPPFVEGRQFAWEESPVATVKETAIDPATAAELEAVKAELAEAEQKIKDSTALIDSITEEKKALQAKLDEPNPEVANLQTALTNATQQIVHLEAQVAAFTTTFNAVAKEISPADAPSL
jgi:hypothetical protein